MFIVPRYHTNMIPLVSGLQQFGYNTHIVAHRALNGEDHSLVKPIVIKSKEISLVDAEKIISNICPTYIIIRELKYGFPRIVRAGMKNGALAVYYEQWPLYFNGFKGVFRQIYISAYKALYSAPKKRITPVLGDIGGMKSKNTFLVPFPAPVLNADNRAYFSNNQITVLCVGKLSMSRKRHIWLINALDEIEGDCQIIVVGSGPNQVTDNSRFKYYNSLINTINRSKNRENIKIITNLAYAALQKLYLKSDVFVLPSKNEPFGMSPIEAMAAGCAVICSDTNGSSCYITNEKDGIIFDSSSYKDFKEKLESVIRCKRKIEKLGQEAHRTMRTRYNHERCINDLLKVLRGTH